VTGISPRSVQDAFALALERWRRDGVPRRPGAWLTVEALEASGELAGYHLLPATRADLLRRLERHAEAAAGYREALELAATDAERRYLARRLAETTRQG
jgi:RNA polymerase sigma-70 factor, ECF subfamily